MLSRVPSCLRLRACNTPDCGDGPVNAKRSKPAAGASPSARQATSSFSHERAPGWRLPTCLLVAGQKAVCAAGRLLGGCCRHDWCQQQALCLHEAWDRWASCWTAASPGVCCLLLLQRMRYGRMPRPVPVVGVPEQRYALVPLLQCPLCLLWWGCRCHKHQKRLPRLSGPTSLPHALTELLQRGSCWPADW